MKTLELKFSRLTASAKFQSPMVAFHHPTLVGYYHKLSSNIFSLSILYIVHYLFILCSALGMRVFAVNLVVFEVYSSF